MPTPIPKRDKNVYFVGAGLSCALKLPNTAMLLDGVFGLVEIAPRRIGELPERLERAFEFFYPDAVHEGYRPDVVDFFSSLRTYLDVGAGLPGGFADAPQLYRSLKRAIVELLTHRIREAEPKLEAGHDYLDEVVQPGNIVITSNWDVLIERCASIREVPVRLTGTGAEDELTLLKLHGSIDWCLGQRIRPFARSANFAMLNECLFPARRYRPSLPGTNARKDLVIRIRALEQWEGAGDMILDLSREPHMVTMARGKAGDLGPLRAIWRDAYGAISRARRLEIVGYSMPPDDIEIRTLLRAGVQRGQSLDEVMVRNPTPEVHVRVRQYLDRAIKSDYRGVSNA